MQCLVSMGDLPVSISWTLNGKDFSSTLTDISTSNIGKKISVLTIDAVSEEHIGDYECQATNNAGQATHTSRLLVNGLFQRVEHCYC